MKQSLESRIERLEKFWKLQATKLSKLDDKEAQAAMLIYLSCLIQIKKARIGVLSLPLMPQEESKMSTLLKA